MFFKSAVLAAVISTVAAQRPSNISICDYYTTALLMNNTAANQMTLLTLVVNTAVIGNYTKPNVGIMVPGILAKGMMNGEEVNLLPYFSGGLASTNTGGMAGRSVNFLDGGGAAPLMENKPANSEDSRQYTLLTHLYEYFGTLLGCSMQGGDAFPAYSGEGSQTNVHKFMDLSNAETQYFIQQVGLSAASFGVAEADVTAVGGALNMLFGYRCAPETTVIPAQGAQLQSVCLAADCPLSPNATCDAYPASVEPMVVNGTMTNSTGGGSSGSTPTTSSGAGGAATSNPAQVTANAAVANGMSFAAVAGGLAALLL